MYNSVYNVILYSILLTVTMYYLYHLYATQRKTCSHVMDLSEKKQQLRTAFASANFRVANAENDAQTT